MKKFLEVLRLTLSIVASPQIAAAASKCCDAPCCEE